MEEFWFVGENYIKIENSAALKTKKHNTKNTLG